ncbi:hypothetical protein HVA01_18980 [Halovibrio variabilis]|uniref:Uncharacterized protein n=1 Tax=Halovibrio variabilis TaxID=31910 RepID=A0A511USU5_9GAMM|nr:hypothetical protein HVA01_18980 [Halovibrio variabilis]
MRITITEWLVVIEQCSLKIADVKRFDQLSFEKISAGKKKRAKQEHTQEFNSGLRKQRANTPKKTTAGSRCGLLLWGSLAKSKR